MHDDVQPAPRPLLTRPKLDLTGPPEFTHRIEFLHQAALDCLAGNIVPGHEPGQPAHFIRAGGGYSQPWTRDAAINTIFAAGLLAPRAARDTLRMVCEPGPDGPVIAQDNQWWDQIIWLSGACHLVQATGDLDFARFAFGVGRRSLALLDARCWLAEFGLYTGPAFMQDGISGYPDLLVDPGQSSSFVLDHAATRSICCLSTNLVYLAAFRSLAVLADLLGDAAAADDARTRARDLTAAIERHLWCQATQSYRYFRYGPVHLLPGLADAADTLDVHQETLGLALALLLGLDHTQRTGAVLGQPPLPAGLPSIWPHFDRFVANRPGRHNGCAWPMIMAWSAWALADAGDSTGFASVFSQLTGLFAGSDGQFFEVYDASDGSVTGGWQCGQEWSSEPDQTWSATGYLATIYRGLLGLRFTRQGLRFAPMLPSGIQQVRVKGLPYAEAILDIDVRQSSTATGRTIAVDGIDVTAQPAHLPLTSIGHHHIHIEHPPQ